MAESKDPRVAIIKSRVNISQFAGTARRRGCPFCGTEDPDMQIYHDTGGFNCFRCGESGDVFAWLMKTQGITFREAMQLLAPIAGIPMDASAGSARTRVLTKVMTHLQTRIPKEIYAYWADRGIQRDTLYRVQAGFCDKARLQELLIHPDPQLRLDQEDLIGARLINPYTQDPFFRHHTVFPYHNPRGYTLQLQGRLNGLPQSGEERWRGMATRTPYGDVNITNLLWGEPELWRYRRTPGPAGSTYAYLCEGIPDALTLRQADLHALSIIGHTKIYRHAWKLVHLDVLYLCLDNDQASQQDLLSEVYRLQLALPTTRLVAVTLPTLGKNSDGSPIKQDINSFFVNQGERAKREFLALVKRAPTAVDLLIDGWGQQASRYEPLLTLIMSKPLPERNRLLSELAQRGLFSYDQLVATLRILLGAGNRRTSTPQAETPRP